MTSKTLTLTALLLATSTMTGAANAEGVRLSMAGPLGSFVAHRYHSSGPGGTLREAYARPHCHKPEYAKPSYLGRTRHDDDDDDAPARKVRHVAPKPKVEVAEEAPAPRRYKKLPKIEQAEEAPAPVKTAKLEDKTTTTDAAPSIFVPDSPPVAQVTGTQSTPAAQHTAALTPTAAPAPVSVTESTATSTETTASTSDAKPAEVKPAEVKPADTKAAEAKPAKSEKKDSMANKLCRKFSAAVAGLIEVPCGN